MMGSDFLKWFLRSAIKLHLELWLKGRSADKYQGLKFYHEMWLKWRSFDNYRAQYTCILCMRRITLWGLHQRSSYGFQDLKFQMFHWNCGATCQRALSLVA